MYLNTLDYGRVRIVERKELCRFTDDLINVIQCCDGECFEIYYTANKQIVALAI
jgi:hypothetical protein